LSDLAQPGAADWMELEARANTQSSGRLFPTLPLQKLLSKGKGRAASSIIILLLRRVFFHRSQKGALPQNGHFVAEPRALFVAT